MVCITYAYFNYAKQVERHCNYMLLHHAFLDLKFLLSCISIGLLVL